mmetsp:Transcript_8760/g.12535  ORF Transcript_8760/g.12535 Transcript_8760/m.12535 type:complete len:110 (-) Transcript_8760:210-539(-)
MLKFNPRKRCTAEEALEHDFLRSVRRKEMEKNADQPLIGPDFLEKNRIDMRMLKQRTHEEVLWYRDQEKGRGLSILDGNDLNNDSHFTSSSAAVAQPASNASDAKSQLD